jgi:hypothetical protein
MRAARKLKDLVPLGVGGKRAGHTFTSLNTIDNFSIFQATQNDMVFATKLGEFVRAITPRGLNDDNFAYVLSLLVGMVDEKVRERP